jgi:hypothetical protein
MSEGPIRAQDQSAVPGERVIDKPDCFAESMIRNSVPVKSTVEVNGVTRAIAGITD